jgi:hypothetical protein
MYLEILKSIIILSVIGFWIDRIASTIGKGMISYKKTCMKEFRENVKHLKSILFEITDHYFGDDDKKDEAGK